ncbi:MAG: S41 family peptidase [Planctomycetota bacterium]
MKVLLATVCVMGALAAQRAPEVVSLSPAHLAEVDAKQVTELVVVFDQPMNTRGRSICGGGPSFPSVKDVQWKDDKTMVVSVELVPNHDYTMSLNCPAALNFRSKAGGVLEPVPWSFSTLPETMRPAAEQQQRNRAALKVLMQTLDERYSYRDLRVTDWRALQQEHEQAILAARTDRGFAVAAARMLRATGDLHLYLRLGERTFATGSRAVDPLFREKLLPRYFRPEKVQDRVLAGRTADGIGYLLIAGWSADIDPEVIGGAITAMADTKALIVDVRPNAGGDESIAQKVAAWFVSGTKVYAKNRFRLRAGDDGLGPVLERTITGNDDDRYYEHPVALLTSRYVMSSNEAFVLMMRQARRCTVVGQPTFGSSGNPRPFELGNGLTAMVPSWQAMRPDGVCFEGEGLAPDVFVPCTGDDFVDRDPILEKALEVLREQLRD